MGQFVVADQTLHAVGGHYMEYALHVLRAAAAAGWKPTLVTSRHCAPEVAASCEFAVLAGLSVNRGGMRFTSQQWQATTPQERVAAFVGDYEDLVARLALSRGDVVLMPTCAEIDVLAMRRLLEHCPAAREVRWHMVFRHNLYVGREPDYPAQDGRLASLRDMFAAAAPALAGAVRFYTDTDGLSAQYGRLGGPGFATLPYPVNAAFQTALPRRIPPGPLRLTYVGDARREKGYQYLPYIAHALGGPYLDTGRAVIVAQSNLGHSPEEQPDVAQARWHLERFAGAGLRLVPGPVSVETYRDLILTAGVAVLLYDATAYYARSSGVLVEALTAGVPVVVSGGSWLAEQIAEEIAAHQSAILDRSPTLNVVGVPGQGLAVPAGMRATTTFASVPGCSHVAVAFQEPGGAGRYLRLQAEQLDGAGAVVARAHAVVGPRPGGAQRLALFRAHPAGAQWRIGIQDAFRPDPVLLHGLSFRCIAAECSDLPLGAAGLIAGDPADAPACLGDIIDHYPHYRQTAEAFARRWRQTHNPDRVVAMIAKNSAAADGLAPALRTLGGACGDR